MTQPIKLLVGLANPGPEYAKTCHNAGAWVVEEQPKRPHCGEFWRILVPD
ncbi:hypothetical protein [Vibrio campbellii]